MVIAAAAVADSEMAAAVLEAGEEEMAAAVELGGYGENLFCFNLSMTESCLRPG